MLMVVLGVTGLVFAPMFLMWLFPLTHIGALELPGPADSRWRVDLDYTQAHPDVSAVLECGGTRVLLPCPRHPHGAVERAGDDFEPIDGVKAWLYQQAVVRANRGALRVKRRAIQGTGRRSVPVRGFILATEPTENTRWMIRNAGQTWPNSHSD